MDGTGQWRSPPGAAGVVLRYRPPSLFPSLAASVLGLAGVIGLGVAAQADGGPGPVLAGRRPSRAALGLVSTPAHAALDPGTGSYTFQMVATMVVAAGFGLKVYGPRLRALLTRRRRPSAPMSAEETSA